VSYSQNSQSEQLGQVFANLRQMVDGWKKDLFENNRGAAVRFGGYGAFPHPPDHKDWPRG
jgi:hypothetical protein